MTPPNKRMERPGTNRGSRGEGGCAGASFFRSAASSSRFCRARGLGSPFRSRVHVHHGQLNAPALSLGVQHL
jgi:hypothetical protein